jgi:hypothetical protein
MALQRVTLKGFDLSEPYIPWGTILLLVQDGRAEVSRFEAPDEHGIFSLDHPANSAQLIAEATQLVKLHHPEALKADTASTFICPEDLAAKAKWR